MNRKITREGSANLEGASAVLVCVEFAHIGRVVAGYKAARRDTVTVTGVSEVAHGIPGTRGVCCGTVAAGRSGGGGLVRAPRSHRRGRYGGRLSRPRPGR